MEREERERQRLERERERVRPTVAAPPIEDERAALYIPSEDKADPNDSEFWSKAVSRASGRVGMVYIPPEEAKPQPPPDDGSDYLYHVKLARWKRTGVWPDEDMLRSGR